MHIIVCWCRATLYNHRLKVKSRRLEFISISDLLTPNLDIALVPSEKLPTSSRCCASAVLHKDTVQSMQSKWFHIVGLIPERSHIHRKCVEHHCLVLHTQHAPFYSSVLWLLQLWCNNNKRFDGLALYLLLNKQTWSSMMTLAWEALKVCGAKQRPPCIWTQPVSLVCVMRASCSPPFRWKKGFFFPSDICVINHWGLCLIENRSMFPQRLGRPLPQSGTAWIPKHPAGFSSSIGPSSVRPAGRPPGTPSAADAKWKNGRGPLLIYPGMQYCRWKHFAAECRVFSHICFPCICYGTIWNSQVRVSAHYG